MPVGAAVCAVLLAASGCSWTNLPPPQMQSPQPGTPSVSPSCPPSSTPALPGHGVTPGGDGGGTGEPTPTMPPGLPTRTGGPAGPGAPTGGPAGPGVPTDGTGPPYPTQTGGVGTPNPGVPGATGCGTGSVQPSAVPSLPLPTGTGPAGGAPTPAATTCPTYAPSDRTILSLAALRHRQGLPRDTAVVARRCADDYLVADLVAPSAGTIRAVLRHDGRGWHAVAVGSYPCRDLRGAPPEARNLAGCD